MAGREGAGAGRVHQRLRQRVEERRAVATDQLAQREREQVGHEVGGDEQDEEPRPPPDQREDEPDRDEDEPVGPDPREPDEDPVERADAVVDDPALEMVVETDQVGRSCFVCAISSRGSNGLPTNP